MDIRDLKPLIEDLTSLMEPRRKGYRECYEPLMGIIRKVNAQLGKENPPLSLHYTYDFIQHESEKSIFKTDPYIMDLEHSNAQHVINLNVKVDYPPIPNLDQTVITFVAPFFGNHKQPTSLIKQGIVIFRTIPNNNFFQYHPANTIQGVLADFCNKGVIEKKTSGRASGLITYIEKLSPIF